MPSYEYRDSNLIDMKNRSILVAVLVASLMSFIIADPLHLVSGKYDPHPYTEIANELNQSSTTGVLVLASYADFYKFPVFDYIRGVFGERLAVRGEAAAEFGYDEVLAQASLGQANFMQYLKSKEISHLIVPLVNAEAGVVFHRWSSHGTIKVDLNSYSFSLVRKSGGEFPLALYKVNFDEDVVSANVPPTYSLSWSGVRPGFYELLRSVDERYEVRFSRNYEEGVETAWVFKGEHVKMTLNSPDTPNQAFTVEIHFVAAYGGYAPPQILRISQDSVVKVVPLKAGEPPKVVFILRNGQSIDIENVLGCNKGTSFNPVDQDIREFCYGVLDVQVRITN